IYDEIGVNAEEAAGNRQRAIDVAQSLAVLGVHHRRAHAISHGRPRAAAAARRRCGRAPGRAGTAAATAPVHARKASPPRRPGARGAAIPRPAFGTRRAPRTAPRAAPVPRFGYGEG